MNLRILAVPALLLLTSCAFADDGGIENVGGTAHLLTDQGHVRMLSESVRARVSRDSISVECDFTFVNTGPADTVLVGFPDRGDGDGGGGGSMTTFRSWVDGTEVPCTLLPDAEHSKSAYQERGGWWTRRICFAEGQRRVVHDHYEASPGSSVDGTRFFQYILETGASWAGTIGRADIIVTLVGISPRWIRSANPRPIVRGHELIWHFDDFEPGRGGAPPTIDFAWWAPDDRRQWEARNK